MMHLICFRCKSKDVHPRDKNSHIKCRACGFIDHGQTIYEFSRAELFAQYAPPFKSGYGYMTDSKGNMVADDHGNLGNEEMGKNWRYYPKFQTRGMGRWRFESGYNEDFAQAMLSAMNDFLLEIVKGHEHDFEKCTELLNKAWENEARQKETK